MAARQFRKLLWSPIRDGENWAQTIVRVSGNLLRWIIMLPLLAGLLLWGFDSAKDWLDNRPYRINELAGVELGMTPTDVTLLKGVPRTSGPEIIEDGTWKQGMFFGDLLVILTGQSEDNLSVYRVCETKPNYYKNILGISGSDSEEFVVRHLGQPDKQAIDDDGLSKSAFFYRYNLMIRFSKAQVDAICVGAESSKLGGAPPS